MLKCPKCDADLPNGAKTCIKCGVTTGITLDSLFNARKYNPKKSTKQGNKKLILISEAMILFISIVFYLNFYMPKIIEVVEDNKQKKQIESCIEDYLGKWDYQKEECITNLGVIPFK